MAIKSASKKPGRPTIDTVTDNVEPHTGVIGQSGLTNDPRPVLSGRGDAGSIIHIRVDNQEVGTVEVGQDGTWTFRLPDPLSDGLFRLSARASNASGQSLPSAAYLIEVDVTPPLQPTIDGVSSDAAAQLSGHAEPYSTVDVYDGNTFLGTAKTGADSSWTFTLPSGMAAGSHALTVKATDLAGNTSEASDGFDYVVGPVHPTARAVVDEAGRDSGLYNNDWFTNNGTSGRLISGHVEGVLGARDRVQISTDGGRTWQDALTKSDGKWMATDPNAHASSWTIQTRVVNDIGEQGGLDSVNVTLKPEAPTPSDVWINDYNQLRVVFDSRLVEPGSKLSLKIDGRFYEHVLSPSELASGMATLFPPAQILTQLSVAIVDLAGNVSRYRGNETVAKDNSFFEDFEGYGNVALATEGVRKSFKHFDVTSASSERSEWIQGVYRGRDVGQPGSDLVQPSSTYALAVTGRVRLDLHPGKTAQRMSFDLGDVTAREWIRLYFYDASGKVIFTSPLYTDRGGLQQKITLDVGQDFSRVDINQESRDKGGVMTWVDNITFSGPGGTEDRPVIHFPSTQLRLDGDMGYYAGISGTTFTLNNTAFFQGANAVAHGGSNVDMLKMTGGNQLLDITAINGGATDKISDIEWIDITGWGNNTLRMSTADVLNLGRPDAYRQDGFSQMKVTGDAGDRLELNGIANLAAGGWTNAGIVYLDGAAFAVYRSEALKAEVFVSKDVAVIAESPSAPKLSMADVFGAGHQDVFQADDGERGAEARVPDGVGYTGLYSVVQDADWMMQSAAQTAFVH